MLQRFKTYKHDSTLDMVIWISEVHWKGKVGSVISLIYLNTKGSFIDNRVDTVLIKSSDYSKWKEFSFEQKTEEVIKAVGSSTSSSTGHQPKDSSKRDERLGEGPIHSGVTWPIQDDEPDWTQYSV